MECNFYDVLVAILCVSTLPGLVYKVSDQEDSLGLSTFRLLIYLAIMILIILHSGE